MFESFFHRGKQSDEGALLEDVKDFADERDMIGHRIRRRHKVVSVKTSNPCWSFERDGSRHREGD